MQHRQRIMVGMECRICATTAREDLPPRERVVRTDHWRVAHAFDTSLPGWLVLLPTVHVRRMDELSDGALAELGPLLARLGVLLRDLAGAEDTYVARLGDSPHLRVHLVPLMPHMADDAVGPAVFRFLGVPEDEQVPVELMDRLAGQLSDGLSSSWPPPSS